MFMKGTKFDDGTTYIFVGLKKDKSKQERTNYKDKLDPALIRHGRFDIQIEMTKFDETRALQFLTLFGYGKKELDTFDITYPISPATLQSKILAYRAKGGK